MGTNPKRTVTVQMLPQLAAVDTLGNKEPNANWATEPHLKLSQVCSKSPLTSPDSKQDNLSLTASSNNTASHTPKNASNGAEPANSTVPDKPVPTSGNQTKSELVTGRDQQMQDLSPTGQGVGEAGGDQRDSNANMKTLSMADGKDICKAGVSPAFSASKVDMQTNDCRIKGPNAAEEESAKLIVSATARVDSNKNVSANNKNLNSACDLMHTTSEPRRDTEASLLVLIDKDTALPHKSQEPDHIPRCSQTSVSPQDAANPKQIIETPAAPLSSTTPLSESKDAEAGFTNKTSSSTRQEKDLPPFKNPQVPSDKHQPVSSQTDSSTLPQATQTMPADGQVAEEASQTDTAVFEAQQQHGKQYREASTMTLSPSSPPVKQCHDMQVQAVANTCSKAVATSPSLLPFTVPRRLSGGAVPREATQSLAVVYQVDGGVGLHQMNMSSVSASTDPRSERLTVEAEMCPNQNASVVFHSETLSQQQDKRLGAKPKDPGSALCNTQPVYQINIDHSHHKEQETGDSQNKTGVQKSAAKTANAEALSLKSGTPPETAGATKPGSADSHKAAPSQAAVTTKPSQALPITTTTTTNTTSKPDLTKKKAESPKLKAKVGGKAQKKEAKSSKQKIELAKKEDEEDQNEKDIHDVVWDEQGMTWEVYGASVDPESLGFAIQSHLQCKIKEQERKLTAQTSLRKSVSAVDSPGHGSVSKRRQQNIFRSMLKNVRRPNCCVHPPPSSVLE
ncbi:G protein-regulated inducer of neurite outgrowth 3 [Clinocottus analis]|uniref:G protein-regulated inducer of neurite outgrowth 3 n=1 Tax=Clinocottus analis TaxID=304258 RepID=UPI0035C1478F